MADSFPRQQARTQRFTLGAPRTFMVGPDGGRVLFLRSPSGTDPVTALWELHVASGRERLIVDPTALDAVGEEATPEERAQRERRRERARGITSYSADAALTRAAFVLDGRLWVVDIASGRSRALEVSGPVFDARLDPAGERVAWCRGARLWVADLGDPTASQCRLAGEDDPDVTWGQAEFVAAEEMGRTRGHWWAPDGSGLLAARVDVGPVGTWWIADPAYPDRAPVAHRYPNAGTPNALVELWWLDLDGNRRAIDWDRQQFPYLTVVAWPGSGPPLILVEQRDHQACEVLEVDVASGSTRRLARLSGPAWVDWPAGLPARLDDGRLVWVTEDDDTWGLEVGGERVTPPGLQVRAVVSTGRDIVFTASDDPVRIDLWRWSPTGLERLIEGGVVRAAAAGGSTVVALTGRLDARPEVSVLSAGDGPGGVRLGTIVSRAETPVVRPSVLHLEIGPLRLRTGVVLPSQHQPGDRWPVLMLPYGGPSAQMVLADQRAWLDAQWRADQGFAVVVADGRGTPGRGPAWERSIAGDLASLILADQVAALLGAAAEVDALDLARVGICGWSFGGYLSALAVLRRPDVFHAAVAGAPVTEWRLYDTYYTERYLGHPDTNPSAYDRTSLLDDAVNLVRPLMLVHGLVDDNVFVAHTLRLSQKLLQAGRAHTLLPLTGMTHMATGEEAAEHLATLQMRFLAEALA
jgi:dipeptidyl-peptidase-4